MLYLRYNMRSQTLPSLPMPIVIGASAGNDAHHAGTRARSWTITNALQSGLRDAGLDLGETNSCVLHRSI